MTYATPDDMTAAFPARDLIQLTNEDPAAQTPDKARLQTALDTASGLIDSYLEGRFTLPFPVPPGPPAVLTTWCIDIAMYRLQCLRPLHDVEEARKRYEDALKALTLVNQGKLALGLTAAATSAAPADPSVRTLPNGAGDALVHSEEQASRGLGAVFTRSAMRGY